MSEVVQREGSICFTELFDADAVLVIAETQATILFRGCYTKKALVAHSLPHMVRELHGLIHLDGEGLHLGISERLDHLEQISAGLGQLHDLIEVVF